MRAYWLHNTIYKIISHHPTHFRDLTSRGMRTKRCPRPLQRSRMPFFRMGMDTDWVQCFHTSAEMPVFIAHDQTGGGVCIQTGQGCAFFRHSDRSKAQLARLLDGVAHAFGPAHGKTQQGACRGLHRVLIDGADPVVGTEVPSQKHSAVRASPRFRTSVRRQGHNQGVTALKRENHLVERLNSMGEVKAIPLGGFAGHTVQAFLGHGLCGTSRRGIVEESATSSVCLPSEQPAAAVCLFELLTLGECQRTCVQRDVCAWDWACGGEVDASCAHREAKLHLGASISPHAGFSNADPRSDGTNGCFAEVQTHCHPARCGRKWNVRRWPLLLSP